MIGRPANHLLKSTAARIGRGELSYEYADGLRVHGSFHGLAEKFNGFLLFNLS